MVESRLSMFPFYGTNCLGFKPKEVNMKYRVLKEISLLTIAQAGPKGCIEFSVEYVKLTLKMRHHDSELGTWVIIPNHDHESHTHFKSFIKWAEEDPRRITWLIEKGFIEKVEPDQRPCI